jgi:monofunctional biosynthetic peptidoglycan transglycosylase
MATAEQDVGLERPKKRRSLLVRLLRALLVLALVALLLPYLLTPLYAYVNPVSTLMLWRWAKGARVVHTYVPIERMAQALPLAVIVAEDGRFCTHRGVDWRELRDIIEEADDLSGLRGGSTITQQTAKNLFLWPGRSFVRKGLELPLAMWIDLVLPKRRILEIYLNIVQWGPNGEFGAEAATRRIFGKPAANLTANQAALLAAVLPNPARRNASQPGPALRRLAGIYASRAAKAPELAACVRPRRNP